MSEERSIQVLSIGSDSESKETLQKFFAQFPDLSLVGLVSDCEALDYLSKQTVDVALLDLGFSDTDAIELTKRIRASHKGVKILIVTASDAPDDIFSALDAGADGYVLKSNIANVLEIAIRSIRLAAVWLDPSIAKQVLQVMEIKASTPSRMLPTGVMKIPLLPDEKSLLVEVASSSCKDGVCMVDPTFVSKLRRFAPD
jgi:DNA-binding NarL/FixJ family response regulator